MNVYVNINSKELVILSNKLEKLRKSALPNTIRNSLNSAAFDVKQKTMPVSADKHFEKRKPNFFKANSKVIMAQGYDIKNMKAVVGFTPSNAEYNNFAVRELEQQEHSGKIEKRTLVPLDTARSGENHGSQILPSNRLRTIRKIIDSSKAQGRNAKEKFVKSAVYAGKKGFVLGNFGKKTLFRINTIKRVDGKIIVGKTALYSYNPSRSVRIKKATHFMREASYISSGKLNVFFQREGMKQIQRVFK